jgi:hypothetical protein
VLQSCIMSERSMYQKPTPFPCSQVVVYLSISSVASLRFSEMIYYFTYIGLFNYCSASFVLSFLK